MAAFEVWLVLTILILIFTMAIMASIVRIIKAYECGILIILGRPVRILYPGYNLVPPMVSRIHRIRMDKPAWEQEFGRFLTPEFSKEFEKFKMDAKKYYKLIIKPTAGKKASISCPNCHKIFEVNLEDYV
jgi:regulator of protease activity HflC (stomatin/prohibitin superfamily)